MADLSVISKIWNILVESNTFNFIIFVAAFGLLFKKIKLGSLFASIQEKILKVIEEAKASKAEAEQRLLTAEKTVANLDVELKAIIDDAEKSAEVIGNKILNEAKAQVENIAANAKKIIDAEEKVLVSKLTKETSLASVQKAKGQIQEALLQNPSLHDKYINESIDELDRLNF